MDEKMITLDLDISVKKFEIDSNIASSFKSPILMKFDHKKYPSFTTYIIINFNKKEMTHIQSFSEENVKTLDNMASNIHSHCVSSIVSEKEFFDFLYNNRSVNNFFKYVNVDKKEMTIYSAKDLNIENKDLLGRTSHHGVNRGDEDNLVISFGRTDKDATETYLCSKDLKEIKKLFTLDGYKFPQHSVETFKDYLFTVEFEDVNFKYNDKIIHGNEEIEKVLKDEFNKKMSKFKSSLNSKIFNIWFKNELDKLELCPGEILIFNLKDLEEQPKLIHTGFAPSHIQFDEENSMLYISCHNFMKVFDNLVLLAPAIIYKYHFLDGDLILKGSFTHPTFWRCPDHMFFKNNNHPYISAMGYPNRLFFIDGETMELHYYIDIKEDLLTGVDDIRSMLNNFLDKNNKNPDSHYVSSITSDDGKYITYWDQEFMHIFDFEKREKTYSVKFEMGKDFIQNTTHSVYI